jgi:D-arabinose 1-dehydrogenase-like Zn-dependent alcohol dehydrogenase
MKMRAIQVAAAGAPFELVQRDVPEPGAGQVRIKVEACGICHSDSLTKLGAFPGIRYPRVPGHEVVGLIDAVGVGVPDWQPGQRVGVGWHGGHCGHCSSCRRGDFVTCVRGQIPGISYDGGYADYMIAPFEALALVPPELKASDAAPLLCAGVTTFNSLRHSGAGPGRSGRRARYRRPRPFGPAIRRQDGLPHGRDRAWQRQGAAGEKTGCAVLHRQ